ncbi:Alpha/Beta hydrolase protein [Mycena alexandri]|uniref:Alpha/Beta hydrolase protein n=1 Tax=Mycena alexandri TaxID=1745969 RepID=A0AAD6SNL2_9AGAR|nr:Alpha/Beta hydrolase protein [Mycena alexandri]
MVFSTRSLVLSAVWSSTMGVIADSSFNWDTLLPSTKLDWKPCYSGIECTRLIVPLDYDSSAAGNATIAIARYPSTSSKSDYLGPILLNPGGPGSSGVDYVVEVGAELATLLGNEFDLVGFDPRGVSYSTPAVSWFKSDAERALWVPTSGYPALDESANAIAEQWARAQVQGQLAEERGQGYLQHITTDNTARDMVRIMEAFGQEKLQYWGISYGSALGATFAALFPDKVGRVVIDGVLDMDAWYSANLTVEETDTDKALQMFADGCFAAGPNDCAFYAPSSAQITANLQALLASVKTNPLPVITPISYDVFGYTLLKNSLFTSLYSATSLFQLLAEGLANLAKGNASTIYTSFVQVPPFECPADSNSTSPPIPFHHNTFEALWSIACNDASAVNDTVSELQQFYFEAQKVSSFADLWANWRVVCSGWKVHRPGRFSGPVQAANTSFPLLVVGNTVDPVTPISGAIKTAQAFPGSVLLTLDAVGHTSVNAPSTCVFGYLREYFVNGTLPEVGTVCTPNAPVFPSSEGNSTASGRRDLKSSEAGRAIGAAQRRVTGH